MIRRYILRYIQRYIGLAALLFVSWGAQAQITNPAQCPSQVVNGTRVYTCNDDVVTPRYSNFSVVENVLLIIDGNFILGEGSRITKASDRYQFNIQLPSDKDVTLQRYSRLEGNIFRGDDVSVGEGAVLDGDVIVDDDVTLEQNSGVTGDVTGGDDVHVKYQAQIGGDVDVSGDVTLEQNAIVSGSITTQEPVEVKYGARVGGDISTPDNVTLGQNTIVRGSVLNSHDTTLGYGALVEGDIYANNDVTLAQNSVVGSSIDADDDVRLEFGARVEGNINARDSVTLIQAAWVEGYVNTPNYESLNEDQVGGLLCDQNGNFGACYGGAGETAQLVGDWHFDQGSWSGASFDVVDSSNSGNLGIARYLADTNGFDKAIPGTMGTCRYGSFDGANHVQIPNMDELATANSVSVSMWFKGGAARQDSSDTYQTLLILGEGPTEGAAGRFEVYRSVDRGSLVFEIRTASNAIHRVEYGQVSLGQPQLFDDQWHHMAASYNSVSQELVLYVDGNRVGQNIFSGENDLNYIGSSPNLYIGGQQFRNNSFLGEIDEVTVATGVYTEAEADGYFTRTRPCPGATLAQCSAVFPQNFSRSGNTVPQPFDLPDYSSLNQLPQQLQPTDYLRVGDFANVGENYETNGNTSRVYIDGDLTIQSGRRINQSGSADELIFVVNGNLTLESNVRINGYIYVTGNLTYYHNNYYSYRTIINGAISVGGSSTAPDSYERYGMEVNYIEPALPLDGGQFCSATPPPPPEPILNWRLNAGPWNGTTGEVVDSSGNSLAGRAVSGTSYQAADLNSAIPTNTQGFGTCGYGYFSNASGQYIEAADNPLLDFSSQFTAGLWIKPSNYPSSDLYTLFSKNESYEVHINPQGRVLWWWRDSNGTARSLLSTLSIPRNQWSYVAVRYRSGQQTIFINGQAAGSATYTGQLRVNNTPLQLGADQNSRYFNGYLDELSLYDQFLSQEQIQTVQQQTTVCGGSESQCYNSSLNDPLLFEEQWSSTAVSGDFTPTIVNGKARLTEDTPNQSTAITLNGDFPAKDNLVEITFTHYAYGGGGADGIALVFSDATKAAIPGSYGGSLGYAQRNNGDPGFNGGWLGIGFDEYGNFSRAAEGRVGGYGGSSLRPNRVVLRGAEQIGYDYLADSGELSPGLRSTDGSVGPGHTYRIRINSTNPDESIVSVARDIHDGNGFRDIIAPFDIYDSQYGQQPYVPDNFKISFTGSTGDLTNIHEFDDIQVCALRGSLFENDVDHYRLEYNSPALTCTGADITVKACKDANCFQALDQSATVGLSLQTGADSWSENPVRFVGSDSVLLQKFEEGMYNLNITDESPIANNPQRCFINGTEVSNCAIQFNDVGFLFTDGNDLSATDIPKQVAGVPYTNLFVHTVRLDSSSGQCREVNNRGSQIQIRRTCVDPGTCLSAAEYPQSEMVVSSDEGSVSMPQSDTTSVGLPVLFDNGQEQLSVEYGDVGAVQLTARAVLPNGDVLENSSDIFVWEPAAIGMSATNDNESFSNGIFARAGTNVTFELKALNEQGQVTPNFGNELIKERLELQETVNVPEVGEVAGTLVGFDSFDDPNHGETSSTEVNYAEVGLPEFVGVIASGDYLAGYHAPKPTASSTLSPGRYIPDQFTISTSGFESICHFDAGYVYIGQKQPLDATTELKAVNANGIVTQNYDSDLSYVQDLAELEFYPFNNDAELTTPPQPSADSISKTTELMWAAGTGVFVDAEPSVTYDRTSPEGPYDGYQLGVQYNDGESGNYYSLIETSGNALNGYDAPRDYYALNTTPKKLRFAQFALDNLFGPPGEPLVLQGRVETWNGSKFELFSDDICSRFVASDVSQAVSTDDYEARLQAQAGGEQTVAAGQLFDQNVSAGDQLAWLENAAIGDEVVEFEFELDVPDYFKVDPDGDNVFDTTPQAQATFGIYQGSQRQIYWREVFN